MRFLLFATIALALSSQAFAQAPSVGPVDTRNFGSTPFTATYGTTARTLAATGTDIGLNVLAYAGSNTKIGQAKTYTDGTITTGTNAFCSNSATFSGADIGKIIQIDGAAGIGSPPLNTTIASYVSTHCITTTANATATTPLSYFVKADVITAGSTGSYVPGETVTITGGTETIQAVGYITDTKLSSATVNAGGTGGTTGTCIVQSTTGTGTPFQVNTTISGGAITSVNSITNAGHFFTNPTSLSAEPVTNVAGKTCAPTGATLTVVMWSDYVQVNTNGIYSVTPSNPVSTGAGPISSATGLTFNASWDTSGSFVYGSDDSAAFVAAINQTATNFAAGLPNTFVYVPPGNYLIDANALPLMGSGQGVVGAGSGKTNFIIGSSYSGDLFSWSQAWTGNGTAVIPFAGNVGQVTGNYSGPKAIGFSVYGNRSSSAQQNAIMFYDGDDYVVVDDVNVSYLNGRCMGSGFTKNQTTAFIRESHKFGKLRCWNDGSASAPVVEFNSAGTIGSNELDIDEIDIYAPYGTGFLLRDNGTGAMRDIKIGKLRIEGIEQDAPGVAADLMRIGDSVYTGSVSQVQIDQLELIDAYPGYAALRVTGASAPTAPNNISVNSGVIAGGVPLGGGLALDAGRSLYFHFTGGINTFATTVTTGSISGSPITVDGNQNQSIWSYGLSGIATNIYQPLSRARESVCFEWLLICHNGGW